jgi:hypothetical protein
VNFGAVIPGRDEVANPEIQPTLKFWIPGSREERALRRANWRVGE